MQYIIVGIGGQGILFTSKVLGGIAMGKGLTVIGSEVHGMAQRGGSVISHFKVGHYSGPLVRTGHADVLMALDQSEGIRNLPFLKEGGTFIVNSHDPSAFENTSLKKYLSDRKVKICAFPGIDILNTHMDGKLLFLNVLITGAACGMQIEGFEEDHVISALKELSPPTHLEANLKVFKLGIQAAQKV